MSLKQFRQLFKEKQVRQKTQKVVADKGAKLVSSAVLQERGKLVTLCCAMNASGNTISPFIFLFRLVKTQQS